MRFFYTKAGFDSQDLRDQVMRERERDVWILSARVRAAIEAGDSVEAERLARRLYHSGQILGIYRRGMSAPLPASAVYPG